MYGVWFTHQFDRCLSRGRHESARRCWPPVSLSVQVDGAEWAVKAWRSLPVRRDPPSRTRAPDAVPARAVLERTTGERTNPVPVTALTHPRAFRNLGSTKSPKNVRLCPGQSVS
jgi:hypothetical protein